MYIEFIFYSCWFFKHKKKVVSTHILTAYIHILGVSKLKKLKYFTEPDTNFTERLLTKYLDLKVVVQTSIKPQYQRQL